MERIRRRWWNRGVLLAAGLIIAASLVSGLFQIAVYLLPSYREDLSAWVTEVAGRPVQIGGIQLGWRRLAPTLDLTNITLFDEAGVEPVLTAGRLSLGFSVPRLLQADVTPARAALSGLALSAVVDAEGRLSLAGFTSEAAPTDSSELLRRLLRFDALALEDCALHLTTPDFDTTLTLELFELSRSAQGFDADLLLRLPPAWGEQVSAELEVAGDPAERSSWEGHFSGDAINLLPQVWLQTLVAPGTSMGADETLLRFDGDIQAGVITRIAGRARVNDLIVSRAGRARSAASLSAEAELRRSRSGWQLSVSDLSVGDQAQFSLGAEYRATAEGAEWTLDLPRLRMDELAPYLAYARRLPPAAARLADLGGELERVTARFVQGSDGWHGSLRGALKGVSLASTGLQAGFGPLSGEFSADEGGGRLEIPARPLTVQLPARFSEPLALSRFGAELGWSRVDGAWRLTAPRFEAALATARSEGRFSLLLPDDAAISPELELNARLRADDALPLKAYMPTHWGPGLRAWLTRGIEAARVPSGQLLIRGPLRDFPFVERPTGEWSLDLDVADARLNYVPDWPVADQLNAQLRFRGNGLAIEATSAQLMENRVERASALFRDFRDGQLVVEARTQGWLTGYYAFLRQSPLRTRLAGLLEQTEGSGAAQVDVRLDIPLREAARTQVTGSVQLKDATLRYTALEEPFRELAGTLSFNAEGVQAEGLAARFYGTPFSARIAPQSGTRGVVQAEFPFAPQADGSGLSRFVPAALRAALSGSSAWRAELPLGVERARLQLASDLVGTAIALPLPLEKAAAGARAIRLQVGSDADAPLRVGLALQDQLAADVALERSAEGWQTRGVELRFGVEAVAPPATRGVTVQGEVADLDPIAWSSLLGSAGLGGLPLASAALKVERLHLGEYRVQNVQGRFDPAPQGWTLALDGEGAQGQLSASTVGSGALRADFARLSLQHVAPFSAEGTESAARASPAFEPARLPALALSCADLQLNGASLGRFRLGSQPMANGLRVDNLTLDGGLADLRASGEWRRAEGLSSAMLDVDLASPDLGALLGALGFAQSVSAKAARFEGGLRWSPSAAGLDWQAAEGRVTLDLQSGTLRALEPGAGRVLGLLNFYAIPRRLLLDFRDVVSSGLAYDRITGSFNLAQGSASTDDLNIAAPSLRMEMRGRVGLTARDYDQRVTVYPDLSSGATLGALLVGGPAVGAITFIAQQVLDRPLDQVSQLTYRVSGSWDNPQIAREEVIGPTAVTPPRAPRS